MIMFERCDRTKRKTCKSDAQVKEWMKDKHLIFVYNRQLFNSDKFGEETFDKQSYMDWIPLDVVNTVLHHYTV
jgi:hypothetical protein